MTGEKNWRKWNPRMHGDTDKERKYEEVRWSLSRSSPAVRCAGVSTFRFPIVGVHRLVAITTTHWVCTSVAWKRGHVQRICITWMGQTHLHFNTKVIYTLTRRSTTLQRLHNFQQPKSKLFTVQCSCYPLRRTPFSNYVRMRTGSLVPRPQITVFGSELD